MGSIARVEPRYKIRYVEVLSYLIQQTSYILVNAQRLVAGEKPMRGWADVVILRIQPSHTGLF